jgi:hypothetical protein
MRFQETWKNMWGSYKIIGLAILLACSKHAFCQTTPLGEQKASFTMHISLIDKSVKPGAEVQVLVDLTNISSSPIQLWHARSGRAPYTVQALDRAGKAAPLTSRERVFRGEVVVQEKDKPTRIWPGGGYLMTIAPGETGKDVISIEDQVELRQPGEYKIQLERVDLTTKVPVKSNTVILIVANDPPPPQNDDPQMLIGDRPDHHRIRPSAPPISRSR